MANGYKHIKAQFDYVAEDKVEITILEQTHRGLEFSFPQDNRTDIFISKKGVCLYSLTHPNECKPFSNYFFVRGSKKSNDLTKIISTLEDAKKLKDAFEEYNEVFGFKPHTEIVG